MEILSFVLLLLISSTLSYDCEKNANELKDPSLKPIFIRECQESSDWSVNTTFKEQLWVECVEEHSITPYKECLSINAILPLDIIHFFVCYELKLGVSTGNVEEGYQYNIFRIANCESPDTHQSDSEMFDLVSQCMLEIKGTVETKIQMEEYVEFWDCVTLHYWYNGHGWVPPTKEVSEMVKSDCQASTGLSQSAYDNLYETKVHTEETASYIKCVLETEGIMEDNCILIDRSWQKFQDLNQTEVIYTLRHCYNEAAGETSLEYIQYLNCVSGKLGRVYG
ncbi:hypothetical protein ACFFRR_011063 [Megaselia abdita]